MNVNYSSAIFRFVFLREKDFIQLGEGENLSSMQNTQIRLFKEESLQQMLLLLCNVTSSL